MDTTAPTVTGSVTQCGDATALTDALADVAAGTIVGGDAIEITADLSGSWTLPARPGFTSVAEDGWIVIRSSGYASLPAQGTRVDPVAHAAAFQTLTSTTSAGVFLTAEASALASGYWLMGLDITTNFTASQGVSAGLVGFGSAQSTQNALSKVPTHLVVDRCYIHGNFTGVAATSTKTSRGVTLHCYYGAVIDSYITDIGAAGTQLQGIATWNGPGPIKIRNNYISASGMCFLTGGQDPPITGLNPGDIEFVYNFCTRDDDYKSVWQCVNLFELKTGYRVLVYGNVFSGCWSDAQEGLAWNFKCTSQTNNPDAETLDVNVCYNRVRNVGTGFKIVGFDHNGVPPTTPLSRIHIAHNIFDRIDQGIYDGDGRLIKLSASATDALIEHNTMIYASATHCVELLSSVPTQSAIRPIFRYNVLSRGTNGLKTGGVAAGDASLAQACTSATWEDNLLIGADAGGLSNTDVTAADTDVFTDPSTFDWSQLSGTDWYQTAPYNLSWGADAAGNALAIAGVE